MILLASEKKFKLMNFDFIVSIQIDDYKNNGYVAFKSKASKN